MKKLFLILFLASTFFSISLPIAALAITNPAAPTKHTFLLNVPIGELKDFTIDANAGNNGSDILGKYIQAWYGFLLGTIGIMATVMIMWGGFKYLTSRGDKGVIDTAKAQIISAITGVALAFGTYSILMLINPQLLTITTPNLPGLQGGGNVKLEQQIGSGETEANSDNQTIVNQNLPIGAPGTWGGAYGYGKAYKSSLPDLGGPNVQPATRNIEAAITDATGYTGTNDYRPGDGSGVHFDGAAVDYPVNDRTNQYFSTLIQGQTSNWSWNGQPGYDLTNVNIGGTVYPHITVIDERTNNHDWHIDTVSRIK